ncbi:cupin domain-containing protein [Bhargavaea ullalensis]|uniref:Mannose-6-phosphate isomerase-like protein (Cupin superfamily) n=1 Tax=Bhargavaea ullalensis TaxID=1265685 RepID=A0ABV2GCZ0_9BACL
MIRKTPEFSVIHNVHGGKGSMEIARILTDEDRAGALRLFARVTVHPHSTIAYHLHEEDSEIYYLLEGKGIFIDNGEKRSPVEAGDFCMIRQGEGHGIENPYDEPIELLAVVF